MFFSNTNHQTPFKSTPNYDIKQTVAYYISLGLAPIPVRFKGKDPFHHDWQNLRIGEDQIGEWFGNATVNIGVLLGTPSEGLVDVDLDHPDAVSLAEAFLPATDMIFGRASKRSSHRIYRVPNPGKPRKWRTEHLGCLVELRSNGQQTVFPGSTHEFGEAITFELDGDPANTIWEELERGALNVALATVLFKRWTLGNRHHLALAVAGFLHKAGWDQEEVENLLMAVAEAAGDDEIEDRLIAIRTTFEAPRKGKAVSGRAALIDLLDEDTVREFEKWLGVQATKSSQTELLDLWTDAGCADAFAAAYKGSLIYSDALSQWYLRKNDVYEPVSAELVQGLVKRFLQDRMPSKEKKKSAFRKALLGKGRINAVMELSRSLLWANSEAFDVETSLVGCADGILLDLDAGQPIKSEASFIVTRKLGSPYDPSAECPVWTSFLDTIFSPTVRSLISFNAVSVTRLAVSQPNRSFSSSLARGQTANPPF